MWHNRWKLKGMSPQLSRWLGSCPTSPCPEAAQLVLLSSTFTPYRYVLHPQAPTDCPHIHLGIVRVAQFTHCSWVLHRWASRCHPTSTQVHCLASYLGPSASTSPKDRSARSRICHGALMCSVIPLPASTGTNPVTLNRRLLPFFRCCLSGSDCITAMQVDNHAQRGSAVVKKQGSAQAAC